MRIIETSSPNHGPRRGTGPVDMLVLHYTGMATAQDSLDRLRDPEASVSSHYLIDTDGTVHRLVAEEFRAWHAGLAYWRGETDVNSRSIGIELQNVGDAPFPEVQIDALITLARAILARHPIRPIGVVGHSDVAPDRKIDPGELFPWGHLARAGIGVFPDTGIDTDRSLDDLLTEIGYDPSAEARIAAFQRRFRPERIDGIADGDCARRAAAYLSVSDDATGQGGT